MNDSELLRAFVDRQDAEAFRQIVARYVGIVYAAARRQVGATHLAEDITQAVFMMLSQRADRVRRGAGGGGALLAGWLVNATRLAAKSAARNERRLKAREQKVTMMKSELSDSDPLPGELLGDTHLLDEALARLRQKDRTALTLRYLQGKTTPEVAATMGISEDAAAKRLSRAVGKLRSYFHRHGVGLTAAALVSAISTGAASAANVPAGLGERAATAALAGHATLPAAAGAASLIAKGALVSMNVKSLVAAGVGIALMLVVGGGVTWLSIAALHRNAAPSPAAALFPPPALNRTIKVGIILSDMTASSIPNGKPYGYGNQARIAGELHMPGIQLYPVIEPGTESTPALRDVLQQQFAEVAPVNGYDAQALEQLDVLVAGQVWLARDEMVAAVHEAVNDGVGLLIRQAFGEVHPGFTPAVLHLHGLKDGTVGENDPWRRQAASEVVGAHVILGRLSGKLHADVLDVLPSGAFGAMTDDAVPLLRLKDIAEVHPGSTATEHPDWAFYPLYTARFGRGKIVACSFNVHALPPAELQAATGDMFTIQCVAWLAAERAAAATQPATPLPAEPVPARRPLLDMIFK